MALKREGPFEIIEVIGPVTYWLKLPQTWKIHNVFHAALLQQYKENQVYGANFDRPPAVIRLSVAGREQQLNKMCICAYGVSTDDSTESSKTETAQTGNTTRTTQ